MAEQSNEEKQKKVRNVDYRARLQLFRGVDTIITFVFCPDEIVG